MNLSSIPLLPTTSFTTTFKIVWLACHTRWRWRIIPTQAQQANDSDTVAVSWTMSGCSRSTCRMLHKPPCEYGVWGTEQSWWFVCCQPPTELRVGSPCSLPHRKEPGSTANTRLWLKGRRTTATGWKETCVLEGRCREVNRSPTWPTKATCAPILECWVASRMSGMHWCVAARCVMNRSTDNDDDRHLLCARVGPRPSKSEPELPPVRCLTHRIKLARTTSEQQRTLKGNSQPSQPTHCQVKIYTAPSVTLFRTDLPRDTMRGNG